MFFKKIKYDQPTVTLTVTEQKGPTAEREETLTSREAPHPDFVRALQALVDDVLSLCELPDDYREGLRVQSVSFSLDDDGNRGAVVTSLKALETVPAPLVLNTPHVSVREGADGSCTMPLAMDAALDTLVDEAKLFYTGKKRAQEDLFGGEQAPALAGGGAL